MPIVKFTNCVTWQGHRRTRQNVKLHISEYLTRQSDAWLKVYLENYMRECRITVHTTKQTKVMRNVGRISIGKPYKGQTKDTIWYD